MKRTKTVNELLDVIEMLIRQNCTSSFLNDNQVSSGFIGSHASAIRLLAEYKRCKILHDSSPRDVTAEFPL